MKLACTLLIAFLATGCISYHYASCEGCSAEAVAAREQRIADLEYDFTTLRDAIETMQAVLTSPPSAYRFSTGTPDVLDDSSLIIGKVFAVDTKQNVVSVSIGKADGVKPGHIFTICRGETYVGKVVVDLVQTDHCSGFSKTELQAKPIEVGDDARTRWETPEPAADGEEDGK